MESYYEVLPSRAKETVLTFLKIIVTLIDGGPEGDIVILL
jgi:hypothetical protein